MKYFFTFTILGLITGGSLIDNSSPINSNSIIMEDHTKTELPYSQIPDAPEKYSGATVLARTVDGLGFRFYWATEGLTDKELDFDPGNENRTPREMMDHFVSLSNMIYNAVNNKPNIRPEDKEEMNFSEKREHVLRTLHKASLKLRAMSDEELENCKVVFQKGDKKSEFPLWNMVNGPLSDALYHTGQIVSQRRSAGNPIRSGVNVFLGKAKL